MLSTADLAGLYYTYEDIMSSNRAPLDEQLAGIQEVLAKAEEALQQLQADENNHDNHPELQATKKSSNIQEISDFIENLRRVTSPMRRVPPEIIGEILLQTLSDDNSEARAADIGDIHGGPWCYVRVRRTWRSEALSHALLWSEFEIKEIIPLFLLDVWLSRSKNTCLKISGHLPSCHDAGTLFQRVVAEIHRWESLQWSTDLFPMMRSVEWRIRPILRLRKLDISGFNFNPQQLMSFSPNLTSLSIGTLSMSVTHSHDDPHLANTFVHANLQSIATESFFYEPLGFGLRYCKFPQLRKLVAISSHLGVVNDMLCRSQCTLEELDVGGYDKMGNLWRILKGQPELRSLSLNIYEDRRNCMLRALLVRRNKSALVSSLEHLSFNLWHENQLPLLLEVLRSRCDESMMQPPTLKSVCILFERHGDLRRFEQQFIALNDKEFNIKLSYNFGRRSCV